jgi:hypothetical protein
MALERTAAEADVLDSGEPGHGRVAVGVLALLLVLGGGVQALQGPRPDGTPTEPASHAGPGPAAVPSGAADLLRGRIEATRGPDRADALEVRALPPRGAGRGRR